MKERFTNSEIQLILRFAILEQTQVLLVTIIIVMVWSFSFNTKSSGKNCFNAARKSCKTWRFIYNGTTEIKNLFFMPLLGKYRQDEPKKCKITLLNVGLLKP